MFLGGKIFRSVINAINPFVAPLDPTALNTNHIRLIEPFITSIGRLTANSIDYLLTTDTFHNAADTISDNPKTYQQIYGTWQGINHDIESKYRETRESVLDWAGKREVNRFLDNGNLLELLSSVHAHRKEVNIGQMSLPELEREFVNATIAERRGTEEDTRDLILVRVRQLGQTHEFANDVYSIVHEEYPEEYARLFPDGLPATPREVITRILRYESELDVDLMHSLRAWGEDRLPETTLFDHFVFGASEEVDFSSPGAIATFIITGIGCKLFPPLALFVGALMVKNGLKGLLSSGLGFISAQTREEENIYMEGLGASSTQIFMGVIALIAGSRGLRTRGTGSRAIEPNSPELVGRTGRAGEAGSTEVGRIQGQLGEHAGVIRQLIRMRENGNLNLQGIGELIFRLREVRALYERCGEILGEDVSSISGQINELIADLLRESREGNTRTGNQDVSASAEEVGGASESLSIEPSSVQRPQALAGTEAPPQLPPITPTTAYQVVAMAIGLAVALRRGTANAFGGSGNGIRLGASEYFGGGSGGVNTRFEMGLAEQVKELGLYGPETGFRAPQTIEEAQLGISFLLEEMQRRMREQAEMASRELLSRNYFEECNLIGTFRTLGFDPIEALLRMPEPRVPLYEGQARQAQLRASLLEEPQAQEPLTQEPLTQEPLTITNNNEGALPQTIQYSDFSAALRGILPLELTPENSNNILAALRYIRYGHSSLEVEFRSHIPPSLFSRTELALEMLKEIETEMDREGLFTQTLTSGQLSLVEQMVEAARDFLED